jgi:multidrug efflux system outer membrane protein
MSVNRWAARTAAVAGAALLGACTTLGPDFKRPEVTWLDTWTGGSLEPLSAATGARSSEKTLEWWRRFNDPVLDRLVDQALRANPNVRTAGLRIMEARAQLGIAGSSLYPQVKQATGEVLWAGEHK